MTLEELIRANELQEQLQQLESVVRCLQLSVENNEKNTQKQQYKRIFRFVNYKRHLEDTERAGIFLFNGLSMHGIEIPVDQEICEAVLKVFKEKLEETKKKFAAIGRADNERKAD